MPDLNKASNEELIELLADPNLIVRCQATEMLVARKLDEDALWKLELLARGSAPAEQRVHAMWVIERTAPAGCEEELLGLMASDSVRDVRVHAMKLIAERPDWDGTGFGELARAGLDDDDAFVVRAAVDALGRHPSTTNLRMLLEVWQRTDSQDTHLIHMTRMALRDHLLEPKVVRLAESLAANAEDGGRLAEVALGARTPASARFLTQWCADRAAKGALRGDSDRAFLHHLVRYGADEELKSAFDLIDGLSSSSLESQRGALAALFLACGERGVEVPESFHNWGAQLTRNMLADSATSAQGIELARELHSPAVHEALRQLASDGGQEAPLRASAIDACVAIDPGRTCDLAKQLIAAQDCPIAVRERAALAIGAANDAAGRETILTVLAAAPDRLARAIGQALAMSPEGAEQLLTAIAAGKASAALLQEPAIESQLRNQKLPDFDARVAALTENIPARDERVQQLIAARAAGFAQQAPDAALGKQVFAKHCAACHRLDDQGSKVGPDLVGIGLRGVERLLEDVLDPNRNVDQAFRATILNTTDGQAMTGLVLREEGELLILVDSQGKEQRIPTNTIEERAQAQLSPMPANVAELIPEQDFYQLMAYLLSQRQAAP
jgi:putative heme-binding domain-containing protein